MFNFNDYNAYNGNVGALLFTVIYYNILFCYDNTAVAAV